MQRASTYWGKNNVAVHPSARGCCLDLLQKPPGVCRKISHVLSDHQVAVMSEQMQLWWLFPNSSSFYFVVKKSEFLMEVKGVLISSG